MAVTQSLLKRSLQLKVKTGVSGTGSDVFKTISFARIKTDAAPQALFNVATSIATLLDAPVNNILVADGSDLINA